jgi:hypothetical protein
MPIPKRGSTLRAQWLGQLLRKAREHAEITTREAGEYIQRDGSTISRMEAGITPARVADVWALMNLYHVPDRMRPVYEQLSRDIWHKGWWEAYADPIDDSFIDYAWLESRAAEIRSFDAMVMPGLTQTPAYAEALITAFESDLSRRGRQRAVEYRLNRQKVLSTRHPPRISAILDEGVLHRRVGGPAVMRDQLAHLSELAKLPNVEIRVLPYASGTHAAGAEGPFVIFDLPKSFPPIAHVPSPAGATYLEEEEADRLVEVFARLGSLALDPERSARFISQVITTMA